MLIIRRVVSSTQISSAMISLKKRRSGRFGVMAAWLLAASWGMFAVLHTRRSTRPLLS
jgi:hypothetical protein